MPTEDRPHPPRLELPEGAITRCRADRPPVAQEGWAEIDLHTPTADQTVPVRAPGFTPAPGIPENAATFAVIASPSSALEEAKSGEAAVSRSSPALDSRSENSPPPLAACHSTPASCASVTPGDAAPPATSVSSSAPRGGVSGRLGSLFRDSHLRHMFLGRETETAHPDLILSRDIEASTCRIPLNPFDHDSHHQQQGFGPAGGLAQTTVTRHTFTNPEPTVSSGEGDFSIMMRTRTFSPTWKRGRPPKQVGSALYTASLEATNSLPPGHPSTTTQTSLLDAVPSLDTAECQLEEGVSARDVKLACGDAGRSGEDEDDLGHTKSLRSALCMFVGNLHPLYIAYLGRAIFSLPLSLLFLLLALLSADWRHIHLSYLVDHKINSRTIIGLGAIERSTETQSSILPAAATVRELPLSFKQILSPNTDEKYCDSTIQSHAAEMAIGNMSVTEALGAATGEAKRARRLALYHLIHGPTFRDVDCRYIRSFRTAGIVTKTLVSIAFILIAGEWWIIGLTLLTTKRVAEAKSALQWSLVHKRLRRDRRHLRAETDPGQCVTVSPSPPFVWPRRTAAAATTDQDISAAAWRQEDGDGWALIDLKRQSRELHHQRHGAPAGEGLMFGRVRRTLKRVKRPRMPRLQRRHSKRRMSFLASYRRRRHNSGGRVCLIGRRRITHMKFTRPSDRLWWRPLHKIERCLGWSPGRSYFSTSILGGSTLMLSLCQTLLLTLALLVWVSKTSRPACLDEDTDLNTCSRGQGFSFLLSGVVLTWVALYCHLKTPSFCAGIFRAHRSLDRY
eukprot:Gregarina_sp_Poly_1__8208@NODE_476_length_8095_cov_200_606004_g385_i0_p1_GENE_NODE_476_length_8095_cov_200_606004_g385_i0NODE_476_length_8095_cov_200_606004_g385_i0_p1_ORF_typecomplete_len791_score90_95_NODE_476_length_8095_cov_200_606004_g385_i056628034